MASCSCSHHAISLGPLLRALYLADSALPIGGYAFSHGLETLVWEGAVASAGDLRPILERYIVQALERQQLPALFAALTAETDGARVRIDTRLDASIAASPEREAGRALGRRLVQVGALLAPGFETSRYAQAVATGGSPGQHAVAMGALARHLGIPAHAALAAFGHAALVSLTGAAARLGVIGASAAASLVAGTAPLLESAVARVLEAPARRRYGAFLPTLEIASARHPKLPFRMFAA